MCTGWSAVRRVPIFQNRRGADFEIVNGCNDGIENAIVEDDLPLAERNRRGQKYGEEGDDLLQNGLKSRGLLIGVKYSHPILRILFMNPESVADTELEIGNPGVRGAVERAD